MPDTGSEHSQADIYQEAGLPLWLRPYEVLVTSSHTALIETIYDTVSTPFMFQDLLVQVQSLKSYFRLFQGVHLFLLIKPVVGSSFLGKHSVISWISLHLYH
jgi:hypothetical protein